MGACHRKTGEEPGQRHEKERSAKRGHRKGLTHFVKFKGREERVANAVLSLTSGLTRKPVHGINRCMNEHERLTFLARHYNDLQGLTLAPLWMVMIFLSLLWHPKGSTETLASMPFVFGICIVGSLAGGRYYRSRFGQLTSTPVLRAKPTRPYRWFYRIAAFVAATVQIYLWNTRHAGWQIKVLTICAITLATLLIARVTDRESPAWRRVAYGVGVASLIAVAALSLFERCGPAGIVATIGITMLCLGIADHLLLLRSLRQPAGEIRA